MERHKSIGVNAGLNMLKTICRVVFPLITFPYVSRVLHVENIGIYNFCQSVVSYFSLAAGLGISTYAIREGARHRGSEGEMSVFASEVFSINFCSTVLSYLVLLLCILFIPRLTLYSPVLVALSTNILFTTIGCEWIFQIYEEYGYITIRNIVFQIISMVLLFLFVKNSDDLLTYVVIAAVSGGGANVINAVSRRKYCRIRLLFNRNVLKHLVPIMVLFASSIATTIYTNSDTTMLGALAGNKATGLYSVSAKIYDIVKQMLAAIIVVSIPRLSMYLGEKRYEEFGKTAKDIANALLVLVVPAVVGIFALSKNIVLIISGQEYAEANTSLKILAIALFFSIFSWFYTSCILIPSRMEKEVLLGTVVAAIANIGLNSVFIPLFQQNAAAFTTVLAEALSMLINWYYGRKIFKLFFKKNDILSVTVGCLGIWAICSIANTCFSSLLISTWISILGSVLFYFTVLFAMKNESVGWIFGMLRRKKVAQRA